MNFTDSEINTSSTNFLLSILDQVQLPTYTIRDIVSELKFRGYTYTAQGWCR